MVLDKKEIIIGIISEVRDSALLLSFIHKIKTQTTDALSLILQISVNLTYQYFHVLKFYDCLLFSRIIISYPLADSFEYFSMFI